jgi:RNA polymerase sigma-70 factor (ECF subfamily)
MNALPSPRVDDSDVSGDEPERETFAADIAELRAQLFRRALFLTQDAAAADDLVQAALERALVARRSFRRGTNLQAWLRAILRNLFIDECRRPRPIAELPREPACEVPSEASTPCEVLAAEDVVGASRALAKEERIVLESAYFKEMSYRQIAAEQGMKLATVGTRLFRAKAKLRTILTRRYQERMEERDDAGTAP